MRNRVVLKAAAPMVTRKPTSVQLADGSMEPIEGWAAKYGVVVERWWGELILKAGCFAESLGAPSDVKLLGQHDPWTPIGIAESFKDDSDGLYMKGKVNTETQAGFEIMSNVKAGILSAFSVGFDILDSEVERVKRDGQEVEREVVTRAELKECSIVTFPAISDAKIMSDDSPGRVRPNAPQNWSEASAALNRILAS